MGGSDNCRFAVDAAYAALPGAFERGFEGEEEVSDLISSLRLVDGAGLFGEIAIGIYKADEAELYKILVMWGVNLFLGCGERRVSKML